MNYLSDSSTASNGSAKFDSKNNTSTEILCDDVLISLSNEGYIIHLPTSIFSCQHRGGRGVSIAKIHTEDFIAKLFTASENTIIFCFTSFGRVFSFQTNMIPENGSYKKGLQIANFLLLENGEKILTFLPIISNDEDFYILLATKQGLVQRTKFSEFSHINTTGLYAMKLKERDELVSATLSNGNQNILLVTKHGMSIRFSEKDIRETKRYTSGVKCISLSDNDVVIGMATITNDSDILVISENGMGKRTTLEEYKLQSRNGKGRSTYRVAEKTGPLVGITPINDKKNVLIISDSGKIICIAASEIPILSLETSGVTLMRARDGKVIGTSVIRHIEEGKEQANDFNEA